MYWAAMLAIAVLSRWLSLLGRRDAPDLCDRFRALWPTTDTLTWRWRVADKKVQLQGKHQPTQWEVHQARVRDRLRKSA